MKNRAAKLKPTQNHHLNLFYYFTFQHSFNFVITNISLDLGTAKGTPPPPDMTPRQHKGFTLSRGSEVQTKQKSNKH